MSDILQKQSPNSVLPTPRLHPFFRLLVCVAGCLALQVLIALVISAALAVAASISGQSASTSASKFISENLLLVNLLVYPPTLLWLWVCRRFLDRRAFVSLGLRARRFFSNIVCGLTCGALACAFLFGVLVISGHARVSGLSLAAQSGGAANSTGLLMAWLSVMICVGFFEEICFRGYALHNLNAWLDARAAIIVQAAAFAAIHLGNLALQDKSTPDAALAAALAMPNIFLIGIFFALCYFKTGSLWFPIAFHAAWNFFLGCVFSLPVSGIPIFKLFDVQMQGSTFLTGGNFGPESSVLLTPILIALCFIIARAEDSPLALSDLNSLKRSPLKFSARENIEVLETAQISAEENEARENRFKATMRPRTLELDVETMATLRILNSERKEREEENRNVETRPAASNITPRIESGEATKISPVSDSPLPDPPSSDAAGRVSTGKSVPRW